MRVLVVSDIHANLAAFEAVLQDAEGGYEAVWCLGDTVGYGPEPDACVELIRELGAVCVVGNHDWAALDRMDVGDFNADARFAVLWTRDQLGAENLAWLGSLPSAPISHENFTLTHGSPRDPIWEYVLYPATAQANYEHFETPCCLVGHTHVPAMYVQLEPGRRVRSVSPPFGRPVTLSAGARVILNPGSVGQPRDNDPRAAYAILDVTALTWEARRVAYPIEVTQAHMRAAGLPERLINRLAYGW